MSGLVRNTTWGFARRIVGGSPRRAQLGGLPHSRLVVAACFLGGAAAGLAGMVEVAAGHRAANASLLCRFGFYGILGALISPQKPIPLHSRGILLCRIARSRRTLPRPLRRSRRT